MARLKAVLETAEARRNAEQYSASLEKMAVSAGATNAALRKTDDQLKRTSNTARKTRQVVATVFTGLTAAAVIRSTVSAIANFEQSMSTLKAVAVTANVPLEKQAAVFGELRQRAIDLGATTRFTAGQAGEGLLFLARAGFTAQEQLDAIDATLALASSGVLTLAESADFASNVVKQFNLAASETNRIADDLINVSNRSNTNVRQLAEALKFAGPVANSLAISLEETAATIGVLGDAGIQASQAGTNLRGVLLALTSPSAAAKRAFEELRISMDEASPAKNNIVDVFENLSDAFEDLTDKTDKARLANDIFGRRNVAAALVITSNTERLRELTQAQLDNKNAVLEQSEAMEDNLAGAFRAARAAIEALQIKVGDDGLTGALRGTVDLFTEVTRELADVRVEGIHTSEAALILANNIKALTAGLGVLISVKIIGFYAGITAAATAATAATGAMSLSMQASTAATASLARGFIGLRVAMAAHPILAIASVLALATTAFTVFNDEADRGRAIQSDLGREMERLYTIIDTARAENRLLKVGEGQETIRKNAVVVADALHQMMIAMERDTSDVDISLKSLEATLGRTLDSAERRRLGFGPAVFGADGAEINFNPGVDEKEVLAFLSDARERAKSLARELGASQLRAQHFFETLDNYAKLRPLEQFFKDNADAIEEITNAEQKSADARTNAISSLEDLQIKLQDQLRLSKLEGAERDRLRVQIEAENIARKGGIEVEDKLIVTLQQLVTEIFNENKAREESTRIVNEELKGLEALERELDREEEARRVGTLRVDEFIDSLERQAQLQSLEGTARAEATARLQLENLARREGVLITDEQNAAFEKALALQTQNERTLRNSDRVDDLQKEIELEKELFGQSESAKRIRRAELQFEQAAIRAQKEDVKSLTEAYVDQVTVVEEMSKIDDVITGVGDSVESATTRLLTFTSSVKDSLKSIFSSINSLLVSSFVSKPLAEGLVGSLSGAINTPAAVDSGKGNMFMNGSVVPFAKGGLITEQAIFPLRGNKVGVVRERGENEAGLAITRDDQGRAVVDASNMKKSLTININGVTDADSFRKSERQIARQMERVLKEF